MEFRGGQLEIDEDCRDQFEYVQNCHTMETYIAMKFHRKREFLGSDVYFDRD